MVVFSKEKGMWPSSTLLNQLHEPVNLEDGVPWPQKGHSGSFVSGALKQAWLGWGPVGGMTIFVVVQGETKVGLS